MTHITIYRNQEDVFTGFCCEGHAGYADAGEDIVCAGISTLVINTINSIEALTVTKILADADEGDGSIYVNFPSGCDKQAKLLVDAMILGLQGIQTNYGKKFLTLDFKEV
ncbi:MAG: ribosomal-processing cysteine protease Prp [Lachnospiraceae bacterium]|nr:ribosomal-processing cysteine protease Prp [Lachnospiraceae bacterium]MDD7177071.1 ribosomal-processing cysteine protease Prp [bacterium]MDY5517109.1 ribosomal-processing cysteine protease Prp [Lachnospiraceae bacterium]